MNHHRIKVEARHNGAQIAWGTFIIPPDQKGGEFPLQAWLRIEDGDPHLLEMKVQVELTDLPTPVTLGLYHQGLSPSEEAMTLADFVDQNISTLYSLYAAQMERLSATMRGPVDPETRKKIEAEWVDLQRQKADLQEAYLNFCYPAE